LTIRPPGASIASMIARELAPKLLQLLRQYPVLTLTGPRQSGKTTLCRMLFAPLPYVSLENLEERDFALYDPKGFLARFPAGAVLDEIQRVPDLLSMIQVLVDAVGSTARFVVTGSQNLGLLSSVSQSLAGRTALARLLPLSLGEIAAIRPGEPLDTLLYTGGYPRIYDQGLDPTEALSYYCATYVERDVRQLINIQDLSRFSIFLRLCATRCGQVLNLSSLGNDSGLNHNTVKSWLSLLEATYIVKLLPPYFNNLGKRLIKAPKLYFFDTGLAAFLLGIQRREHLAAHPLRGALFENMVVAELLKKRANAGRTDNLFYLRDSRGHEVDILLDYGAHLDMIEIKAGQTVGHDHLQGLQHYGALYPATRRRLLIHGGDASQTREGVEVLPWQGLAGLEIA